jgi:DNA-binding PadR family transcriptional regulator
MRHHEAESRHRGPHGGRLRLRHGDVRAALLLALEEGPTHGYELGERLERRSGGAWRPSPGSIYPNLQTLADEDCVTSEERDGKRIYTLTRKGLAELKQRAARGEEAPWQGAGRSGELREAVAGLKMAARQVVAVGTPEQHAQAVEIVVAARRRVYELLAKG